jgi:pyoverdine/dityrosine biosynthesis protein Dit1
MMKIQKAKRTPLEALYEDRPPALSELSTVANTYFDSQAGIFYNDRRYHLQPGITIQDALPSDEWITRAVHGFVRAEFANRSSDAKTPEAPPEPVIVEPIVVDWDETLFSYLESCERALVYSGYGAALARSTEKTVIQKLYALFTHRRLGNVANARNVSFPDFERLVQNQVNSEQRLLFIFPGFPFKDQNPFRTLGVPWRPDLAEAALMIRLHAMSLAIYQSYQMSSDWLILTDGSAFSSALRVPDDKVRAYHENLLHLRNRLDIGRSVHFLNYLDVAELAAPTRSAWQDAILHLERRLLALSQGPIAESINSLALGMRRNVDLTDMRDGMSWFDWWDVLHGNAATLVAPRLRKKWLEVSDVCSGAALQYAAFNLATKWFQVDSALFPNRIRATIHAKRGQLAVPKIGSEFPWNGTAFVGGVRPNVSSVGCRAIHDIGKGGRRIKPHVDADGQHVLYVSYEN